MRFILHSVLISLFLLDANSCFADEYFIQNMYSGLDQSTNGKPIQTYLGYIFITNKSNMKTWGC